MKKIDEKPKEHVIDINSQNSQNRNYMAATKCSQLKNFNTNNNEYK